MFPRLYAILDLELCHRRQLDPDYLIDTWLEAGVRLVQLRAKQVAAGAFLDLASGMADRVHRAGATFIVNDRADVAKLSGADGVHLGQDDLSPADVRGLLPRPALVGCSTHNAAQLRRAVLQPIDYLAIGPVFATGSKANPEPVVGLEGVRLAAAIADGIPVVAIGGITAERAPEVLAAGASAVAAISDLLVGDLGRRWGSSLGGHIWN